MRKAIRNDGTRTGFSVWRLGSRRGDDIEVAWFASLELARGFVDMQRMARRRLLEVRSTSGEVVDPAWAGHRPRLVHSH